MIEEQNTLHHAYGKPHPQIGPVTRALRAMREDTPEQRELRALRAAIEARIEADIALLDKLDGGEFRR